MFRAIASSGFPGASHKALAYHAVQAAMGAPVRPAPRALSSDAGLVPYEAAVRAAREALGCSADVGLLVKLLRDRGYPVLAQRLRSSARARGAHAHPDPGLAGDLAKIAASLVDPLSACDPSRAQPEAPQVAASTRAPPSAVFVPSLRPALAHQLRGSVVPTCCELRSWICASPRSKTRR